MRVYSYTERNDGGEFAYWFSSKAAATQMKRNRERREAEQQKEYRRSYDGDRSVLDLIERLELDPSEIGEINEYNFTPTKKGIIEFLNRLTS